MILWSRDIQLIKILPYTITINLSNYVADYSEQTLICLSEYKPNQFFPYSKKLIRSIQFGKSRIFLFSPFPKNLSTFSEL